VYMCVHVVKSVASVVGTMWISGIDNMIQYH